MKEFKTGNIPAFSWQMAVKKPIPIRVHQIDEDFSVVTPEGTLQAKSGDYLVVGVRGELYPISKAIFEETYDIVQSNS